jgi:DNA polymerase
MPDDPRSDEQIKRETIAPWRAAHPAICSYWRGLYGVLHRVVATKKSVAFKNLGAEMRGGNLCLRLPGMRELVYPEARLEPNRFGEPQIVYKDNARGAWADVRGWHGTFVENVVQAIARDLLAAAMQRLEGAGYPIVLHVHDEIVAEVLIGYGSPRNSSN